MEIKVKLVWAELFSKQVPKELGLKYFLYEKLFCFRAGANRKSRAEFSSGEILNNKQTMEYHQVPNRLYKIVSYYWNDEADGHLTFHNSSVDYITALIHHVVHL